MTDRTLADMLQKLMKLGLKYDFTQTDLAILMDRCLLLGEACAFLEELGLFKELEERHEKVCKEARVIMNEQ